MPATKGSCCHNDRLRACRFSSSKTLCLHVSATKGFYYDENDCRPAMSVRHCATDHFAPLQSSMYAPLMLQACSRKHCRLAMKHRRPLEAFDALLIDPMRPCNGLLAIGETMPSAPSPALMQNWRLVAPPVFLPGPPAGAGRVTCCGGRPPNVVERGGGSGSASSNTSLHRRVNREHVAVLDDRLFEFLAVATGVFLAALRAEVGEAGSWFCFSSPEERASSISCWAMPFGLREG